MMYYFRLKWVKTRSSAEMNNPNIFKSNAIRAEVKRHESMKANFAKLFKQLERVDDQQMRSGLKVYLHSIQGERMPAHYTGTMLLQQLFPVFDAGKAFHL